MTDTEMIGGQEPVGVKPHANRTPASQPSPAEQLLNAAEQIACASYVVAGSPDLVRLREAIAKVKAEQPSSARSDREPFAEVAAFAMQQIEAELKPAVEIMSAPARSDDEVWQEISKECGMGSCPTCGYPELKHGCTCPSPTGKSPARSDKEAEPDIRALLKRAEQALDMAHSYVNNGGGDVDEIEGASIAIAEFLQSPAGQAQESAPSSEGIDLDKLEALARAADPGIVSWHSKWQVVDGITDDDDCNYIAALSPAAVLDLIALARRATAGNAAPACTGCDPAEGFCRACREAEQRARAAATAAPGDLPTALDRAYPIPDSPHASVIQRAQDNRHAFSKGWRACIASNAGAAPRVPEGWKLVPIQPTDAMRDAGNVITLNRGMLFAAWRAMLAAAPSDNSPVGATQDKQENE